jgi:CBS domain-containing protein
MTATHPPIHRLASLHAADIMQKKVFKLDPQNTVEEAVQGFTELHISGAPVVDRAGKLVGVLSAYDIARPENMVDQNLAPSRSSYSLAEASADDDGSYEEDVVMSMEDYSPATLRTGTVSDLMSTEPITVTSHTTLKTLCALMVKEHIHRVFVVDSGKLVGVISTLDVARCVAEHL